MIASYMDESFDTAKSGVFAVGGILGRGIPLFELERKWKALRADPDVGIAYFKASECESGAGEFTKFVADTQRISAEERDRLWRISQAFLKLISTEDVIIQGVGIVQSDFYDVITDPRARVILGDDPYRLAYDLAMIQCAWAMKQLGNGEVVAFVCDEHQRYSALAPQAYRKLKSENPDASRYMATFSSADDRNSELIQAADAVVFEIRRALKVAFRLWPGQIRQQFDILANAHKMFLIQHTEKGHLLHIVATHAPGEPFRLDDIMQQSFDKDIGFGS